MTDVLILLAGALALVLVGILAYAWTRPDSFHVARSATVSAPPESIFPLIVAPRAFNRWNPFLKEDPAVKLTFSGPDSGVGAGQTWDGNKNVGKGSVEVTAVEAPNRAVMRLDMLKPMVASNRVEFTLEPRGHETVVTWAMSGAQPFIGKLVSLFINCDRMCADQFDAGLRDLKSIVETEQRSRRASA